MDSPLDYRSKALRKTILQIIEKTKRGHLGAAFSIVEILRVLYDDIIQYDASYPKWPLRYRCILSKGHGCLALYVILADKGFFPASELMKFCQSDGLLGGHPETKVPGVEVATGSLGHGLSIGIGFALNAKYEKETYKTYVIIGDGESNEGSIWEAALCASKHKLDNLIVLIDYNKHQSYGSTYEVLNLEPFADKWRAIGFAVTEVDGHCPERLKETLAACPITPHKPTAIICHTVKGKGIKHIENNMEWHHINKISQAQLQSLYQGLEAYS